MSSAATHANGDDRPSRYMEYNADGTPARIVYRASSIGGCERALVAIARGMTPEPHPDWFQDVLDEGHEAEPEILAMWDAMKDGPGTSASQAALELWLFDTDVTLNGETFETPVIVRGHVDGFTERDGLQVIVEAKKFRPSTYPNFLRQGCEVNANYPWQVSTYMHAFKQSHDYYPVVEMIGGLWGVLAGEPEGTPNRVLEVSPKYVDNPPIPLKAIRKKVLRIEELLDGGFAPTDHEVVCLEKSYPCGFWKLHPSYLTGEKQTASGASGASGAAVAAEFAIQDVPDGIRLALIHDLGWSGELKTLAADTKRVEQARKEGRATLMAWLDGQGVKPGSVGTVDGIQVEYKEWSRSGHEVKPSSGVKIEVSNPTKGKK